MANTKKDKKLGRGLEALLGNSFQQQSNEKKPQTQTENRLPVDEKLKNAIKEVKIQQIDPNPYQPRTKWDQQDLSDLAQSIKENGIIQPVILRETDDGYEIIAGERRVRAAEIAGLDKISAIVRNASDSEMLELAIVENIHRSDLNPIEKAEAYQNFIDTFNITQAEAAKRLGQDRSALANHLRLLTLPSEIKKMLIDKSLSMGHARAILAIEDDQLKKQLANKALAGRLSVRDVERLVRTYQQRNSQPAKQPTQKPPHIQDLENRLRDTLGTKVTINTKRNGQKGRIVIEFYSIDEFDRLSEKMGVQTEKL
jgi:ParB family chromosome partitioning protein